MARISRAVPLDQLRQPETDVRERRPEEDVMSLAASMGDPNVGQLQDVLVHPVDYNDVLEERTDDELHELFQAGHPMRIVDGETRRLAAEKLGWATLDATIVPEPPESTVVAQLDANTERIEMTEFETVRALYEFYQETDATLQDVGDKTGYSESYLSNVFGLMDCPDWLRDAWQHPDHPLETSHALAVKSMLSDNTLERYQQAGGLDEHEAWEQAVSDGQLMIDVQGEHQLPVGEFRKRCKRCVAETLDQLKDQRTLEEKQADGQTQAAEDKASAWEDNSPDPEPCLVCGDPADRKIALDVCQDDYGMLADMKAQDEVLMAQADSRQQPQDNPAPAPQEDLQAVEALAQATGISPQEAEAVIHEVQQQAAQPPQED